jgi:hypothetical protein
MRYYLTVFVGLMAILFCSQAAFADRRVALVVGNAQYVNTNALRNPANDAEDVAAMLGQLGFEVVVATDLDQVSFARRIDEFARVLEGADVGLFFYAGHGLQLNEKNYLVSTNAKLESEFLVPTETIELDAIIRLMESRAAVNLIFLDACRNNPLADNLRRSLMSARRSVSLGRGLAKVEATGHDTLVAFSAAPGQEASDGESRNSPFAASLLRHAPQPGLEVSVMLKLVAADVRQATRNAQRPQQLSDMTQAFYFAKDGAAPAVAPSATPAPLAAPAATAEPGPAATSVATVAPAPAPAPPPNRPAPPQDDRAGEFAAWQAARASSSCEPVRDFLRRYPNGAFSDLAKFSEQRLCAPGPVADLPPPRAVGNGAAPEAAAPPTPAELARNIQLELMRVGCTGAGAVKASGDWDAASQGALRLFNRFAKLKLDVSSPSQTTIDALRGRDGRVCPLVCGDGFQAKGDTCVATPDPPAKSRKAVKSDPDPDPPRRSRRSPRDDSAKSAPDAPPSRNSRRASPDDNPRPAPDAPRRVQRGDQEAGQPPSGGGPIGPGLLLGIGGGLLGGFGR